MIATFLQALQGRTVKPLISPDALYNGSRETHPTDPALEDWIIKRLGTVIEEPSLEGTNARIVRGQTAALCESVTGVP
jgi:hypothetical protein